MVCVSILENKIFGYFSHIPCYVVAFLSAVSKPQEFSFLTKAWDGALCMEGSQGVLMAGGPSVIRLLVLTLDY